VHFFITGHTGFKGAWLTVLLKELGHTVSGYSLAPVQNSLYLRADIDKLMKDSFIADIRDYENLRESLAEANPDFVIHLAAQPLVLQSYLDPLETYTTNVDGTRNILQAVTEAANVSATLIVTTDKVYADNGKGIFKERDPLGGHDPYSTSKAMADLLTQSWAAINPQQKIHVARAGNVIGAYDVSKDRLLPDILQSLETGKELHIRNPDAVRPWQHVLDCLAGYLTFIQTAATDEELPIALNFGPDFENIKSVKDVIDEVVKDFPQLQYNIDQVSKNPRETQHLSLDSSLAMSKLSWQNKIGFEEAIGMTLAQLENSEAFSLVNSQARRYLEYGHLSWPI
jgi:CDP-glucose 4,6-dehydratase